MVTEEEITGGWTLGNHRRMDLGRQGGNHRRMDPGRQGRKWLQKMGVPRAVDGSRKPRTET